MAAPNTPNRASTCLAGCTLRPGHHVFATLLDALPADENNHGLLVMVENGEFKFSTRSQRVVSVCSQWLDGEPVVCALPKFDPVLGLYDSGLVHLRDEAYASGDATTATQVRRIGSDLYVTGMGGGLHRKTSEGWASFNQGMATPDVAIGTSLSLSDVEAIFSAMRESVNVMALGGSERELFAVSSGGQVFFRQAGHWLQVPAFTQAWLTGVAMLGDQLYVVGHEGLLAKGNALGFVPLDHGVDDDSFTCAVAFRGELFVGGYRGLYCLKGERLQRLQRVWDAIDGDFKCVSLDANEAQLLVVGERGFAEFDGEQWRRTLIPGNTAWA